MAAPEPGCSALVVCYSNLEADPRVTRQIEWLLAEGWIVDTLGLGPKPRSGVREHFAMTAAPAFTRPRLVKGLIHLLLPYRQRFRVLVESQIPRALHEHPARHSYDLVLANDIDLLPWLHDRARSLLASVKEGRVHLDVHEYHYWAPESDPSAVSRFLLAGYHRWMTGLIASPAIDSRSTVAAGIAELYRQELQVERPSIVRNSPPFLEQEPSDVDPERIELVYHGNAEMARGLDILIDAFTMVDERFHLNLMVTGSTEGKSQLRALAGGLARVAFIDPVPMAEVAHKLNAFDLEVIFYPPTSPNFLHSFPNKFFEAVQGRLGVVVGESPSMSEIVAEYGNGHIVHGWTASDLADAINSLTVEQIQTMKRAAGPAALELNAEREKRAFFAAVTGGKRT